MSKNILIIAILVIATIGLAATAGYIVQRQVAKEVRQERVATRPEIPGKPVVQPTAPLAPSEIPAPPTPGKPEPTSKTETDETANWITFRNIGGGFQLKYPPELSQFIYPKEYFKDGSGCPYGTPCGVIRFDFSHYMLDFGVSTFLVPASPKYFDQGFPVRLLDPCVRPIPEFETSETGEGRFKWEEWKEDPYEEKEISGIKFKKYTESKSIWYRGKRKLPFHDPATGEWSSLEACYQFDFYGTFEDISEEEYEKARSLFEKIVSTFKTIDASE